MIDWRATRALAVGGRLVLTVGLHDHGVRLGCVAPEVEPGAVVSVVVLADDVPTLVCCRCVGVASGGWAEFDVTLAEGWPLAAWAGLPASLLAPRGGGGVYGPRPRQRLGLNVRKRKPPKKRKR